MNQVSLNIKLLSPVVLSNASSTTVMTESLDCFTGTALRGILADRYIACKNLGKNAHNDEEFRQLFFNKLRFIDANPFDINTGNRSFVVPLSIQREKSGSKIQDLINEESPRLGYKNLRGYAFADGKILYTMKIKKNIHLHMSRGSSNERLLGSSRDGNIYNYESIDANQQFQGLIIGNEEDIKILIASLKLQDKSFTTYVGRSKYTQYGKCQITFNEITNLKYKIAINADNSIYLRFDTTFIPKPGLYRNVNEQLQEIVDLMNQDGMDSFQIDEIYAAQTEVENFVGIWKMRRPCEQALSAGTIFRLKKDSDWTEEELFRLNKLLYEGCGIRREEGFGQLCVWSFRVNEVKEPDVANDFEDLIIPVEVKEIVQNIIKERILNQLRIYAAEDVNKLKGIGQLTHFFNELDNILLRARVQFSKNNDKKIAETMKTILQDIPQNKKGRPFNDHMTKIDLYGNNLENILVNDLIIPYKNRNWQEDIGGIKQLQGLSDKINLDLSDININDGEYFYEYWHCLFRSARKKASINKEVI